MAEFAYNNSVHDSTKLSPFEANTRRRPRVGFDFAACVTEVPWACNPTEKMEELWKWLKERLKNAQITQKGYYNQKLTAKVYELEDMV